jgi:branched-chain amino acid transport system substrate-binding protein
MDFPVHHSRDLKPQVNQKIHPGSAQNENIKIGLLIPDNKSLAARNGAEIAIRKANEQGGYKGRSFSLVIRSAEGSWGTGSREAVSLIFNDEVCSIMGCLDGRNAHIVEQVSVKTRIVFLSAWATDPTLSKAFVPWYFSCVPNDLQQAESLIHEIYDKRKLDHIAAISDSDYDAKLALTGFVKKVKERGKAAPSAFYYNNSDPGFAGLTDELKKAGVKAFVLFGQPSASLGIIREIRKRKMEQPVFGTLSTSCEDDHVMQELSHFDNIILISSGQWFSTKGKAFDHEFEQYYGHRPDAVSAYAYDGMNLIIGAIKESGPDRERIQRALLKEDTPGVTGDLGFDEKGNRSGNVFMMEVKNGHLIELGTY